MLIRDRDDRLDLSLAVALAISTGYVDAIAYTRLFGVFPANQSGNVVFFGVALGDGRGGDAWRPALAMVAFAIGVFLATRAGRALAAPHRRSLTLGVEAAALALLAVLAGDVLHTRPPVGGVDGVVGLALASVAMGLQTVALGRVAGVSVSTTYQSGAIVRLSESAVDATHRAEARRVLVILAIVVGCYAAGAAAGAFVGRHWGGALWLSVAAVAACALTAGIRRRASGSASGSGSGSGTDG